MKTSRFRSRPRCPLSRSCCGKSGGSPPSDGVYRTAGSEGQEHRPRTGKERASARPGPAGVAAPDATPLAAYGRAGTAPGRGAWTAGGRGRHQRRPGDTVGRPATEPGVDPCPRRRSAGGSGPQGLRGRRRRGRQVRERRAASPSERTGPEAAGRGEERKAPGAEARGPGSPRQRHRGRVGRAEGTQGRPQGAAQGAERDPGPARPSPARYPRLTVPPSLMMIFLASMILRFAARFFFFPWVILPSSTPGAAAATPGAAGPSGECRPATTAGPSRSGRPPPS